MSNRKNYFYKNKKYIIKLKNTRLCLVFFFLLFLLSFSDCSINFFYTFKLLKTPNFNIKYLKLHLEAIKGNIAQANPLWSNLFINLILVKIGLNFFQQLMLCL